MEPEVERFSVKKIKKKRLPKKPPYLPQKIIIINEFSTKDCFNK